MRDSRKQTPTARKTVCCQEHDGFQVETAEDGLAGLEAIRRTEFDLALIDIGLPELDGYPLAHRVRLLPGKQRST
ncbi:MAG: response regulator [Pirellulales bacterium]|nr:response regulator [Pirellulales bacterium]